MKIKSIFKKIYLTVTIMAALAATGGATYAWFSTNTVVQSDKVTGRSGTADVQLLLSSVGGNGFSGAESAAIVSVNDSSSTNLMPVTTYDLKTFLYNPSTVEGVAVHFKSVPQDTYYYHGRIYMKAMGDNQPEGAKVALYLDESDRNNGKFLRNVNGYMVNAARLGLTFDGGNPIILRFSEQNNPEADFEYNTGIEGDVIRGDYVLTMEGDKVKAHKDPSVKYTQYLVGEEGLDTAVTKPLLYLELNREYVVDIYFYLEGCDPDCTDVTERDSVDFQLGFYGIVTEEELNE